MPPTQNMADFAARLQSPPNPGGRGDCESNGLSPPLTSVAMGASQFMAGSVLAGHEELAVQRCLGVGAIAVNEAHTGEVEAAWVFFGAGRVGAGR